jgi:hypothetical protein
MDYEKILKSALQSKETPFEVTSWIEEQFPELAESEDEKIKKQIIYAIKELPVCGETKRKCIAWLEKQGEKEKFVKKELDCIRGYRDEAIRRLQELEKQCEPTEINPSEFDSQLNSLLKRFESLPKEDLASSLSFYLNVVQNDGTYNEEKQGDDKAETKFKVGDWICHTVYKKPLLIVEDLGEGDFRTEPKSIITAKEFREGIYRLWTIQDAKDGDVLCTYECGKPKIVFILKGAPKKPYVLGFHCYYNIMYPHFEFNSEKGCLAPNVEDIKPATKEQRDTLMKAMSDGGYTFDFEKKELKPTDLPKGEDYGIDGLYAAVDILQKTLGKVEGYQTDDGILEHECAISAVKDLSKQKPTEWSEKDSLMLDSIISIVEEWESNQSEKEEEYYGEFSKSDWLKYLKDRVQPQPKQEWSDEDESAINDIISILDNEQNNYQTLSPDYHRIEKLKEKIKSLRPQKQWKPSEEQIIALRWVLNNIPYNKHKEEINGLFEQIKDL